MRKKRLKEGERVVTGGIKIIILIEIKARGIDDSKRTKTFLSSIPIKNALSLITDQQVAIMYYTCIVTALWGKIMN